MSTTKKPALSAVPDGATAEMVAPLSIVQAAELLDYRALREATLVRLAHRVQDDLTAPRDLAALSRRMLDVADELEEQDDAEAARLAAEEAAEAAVVEKGTGTSGRRGTAGKPFSLSTL